MKCFALVRPDKDQRWRDSAEPDRQKRFRLPCENLCKDHWQEVTPTFAQASAACWVIHGLFDHMLSSLTAWRTRFGSTSSGTYNTGSVSIHYWPECISAVGLISWFPVQIRWIFSGSQAVSVDVACRWNGWGDRWAEATLPSGKSKRLLYKCAKLLPKRPIHVRAKLHPHI